MHNAERGPFWAGGNAQGWFVNFHKEPEVAPGRETNVRIRWFDSRDWGGELGAAKQAEALAVDLNAAIMGAGLVPALKRARMAVVYASDCMGSCSRDHTDGRAIMGDEYDKITEALTNGRVL